MLFFRALAVALVGLVAAGLAPAGPGDGWKEVAPDDLPGPVIRAVRETYPKDDIERTFAGVGRYQGRFRAVLRFGSGARVEAELDGDGTVLGGRDLAADVPVKELPAPVAAALRSRPPEGSILYVRSVPWKGGRAFQVVLDRDGRRSAVTFMPDGAVAQEAAEIDPASLPPKVVDALRVAYPEARVARAGVVTRAGQPAGHLVLVRPPDSALAVAVRFGPEGRLLSAAPVLPPGTGEEP